MRRLFPVLIPVLLLGGCARAPEKERQAVTINAGQQDSVVPVAGSKGKAARPVINLSGDGLAVVDPAGGGGQPITFGVPRDVIIAAVARSRGDAVAEGENAECGAGPMEYANFRGGLVLNFQDAKFAGWSLNKGGDTGLATAKGIRLGSTRGDLDAAGKVDILHESLGTQFELDGLSGLLDSEGAGAAITDLWAGATCIAT